MGEDNEQTFGRGGSNISSGVEKESASREIFSQVRDLLSEGTDIVKDSYGREEGDPLSETERKLGSLSQMVLEIENNPEAFSCVEMERDPWTDNFGNVHETKTISIAGHGSYSLGIYIENLKDYQRAKNNLIETVNFDITRAGEIEHQAGYGNRSKSQTKLMLEQAENLIEKAKQLALKWVRKVDFSLVDEQTPIIGVTIADTPYGLTISPRDPLDIKSLQRNKMGFLFASPVPLNSNITYDDLIEGINEYPKVIKNLRDIYTQ
jgi:hypothetical protein